MELLCLGYCRLRLLTTVNNNTIVAYVVNLVVRSYATTVYLQCIFGRCPFRLGVTLAAKWIEHWLLGWDVNLADVVLVASDVLLQ